MKNKSFAISIVAFFLPVMLFFTHVNAQNARMQLIHNSADTSVQTVDIYVNGVLFEDDLQFRTATEFRSVTAGEELNVQVAPGNSERAEDAIATFPLTFEANQTYIVIASGIVSEDGYSQTPAFKLDVFPQGREQGINPANTDVLVYHGVTDAPTIDIVEVGVGAGTLVEDIAYSQFSGYLELNTDNYVLDVRDQTNTTLASFNAPLATMGLQGDAIVIVASGFLEPENNNNGKPFGLFVAPPSGGELVALRESDPSSVMKIAKDKISIYPNPVKGILKIDFVDLQINEINIIDITGKNVRTIIPNHQTSIELKDLPLGTYFIRITTDERSFVEKINVIK